MAADLDKIVEGFHQRPTGAAGPFTTVAADALTMKVREGGRVINAVVVLETGVNGDGHREGLGMRVATSETGPAWKSSSPTSSPAAWLASVWSALMPTPG